MTDKQTGGPAFPQPNTPSSWTSGKGMTLRDYFAAKAMQGKLARGDAGYNDIAAHAYKYADAMLKAREQ